MRPILLVSSLMLFGFSPAEARLRAPSCEALIALAVGARFEPIEASFGKPVATMSVDEFDQAIDIVSVCVDEVVAGPADVPGLLPRERKRNQLNSLTMLAEDLKLYRSRQREREQRAARRGN